MPGQTADHAAPAMCWVQPEWRAQFAVGSDTGLRVYRLAAADEARAGAKFELVEFQSTRHAVTALASYPRSQAQSGVLAVGNTEGEVNLHFLASDGDGDEAAATGSGIVNVYGSTGRQCRSLAFNATHGDLLACGFDFKEGKSGLHIYDISRSSDVRLLLGQAEADADADGAGAGTDTGGSSSNSSGAWVTSLAWVPGSVDDILVASRQTRGVVRLYDLRGRQASETVLHMSASGESGMVYDVQFDPFNSVRYLAHDRKGRIGMWDLRWPPEALHMATLGDGIDVHRVAFSPRRRGVIAAMAGGSVEVLKVNEFIEGRPGNADASARAVLEETRMRDHFDDERPSAAPPAGLRVWTERAA
ncbi:hypothetical protein LPJ56_005948, partial [Coemansia sp. RSA 2599]